MIEVKDLRKAYGPIIAVDGISFAVGKGDVMGFLGPNGAGKSTTMKMLACFLEPDSGTASINGFDIVKNPIEVRQCLGYVAESAPAYDEMTPEGFLKFVCDARGFSRPRRRDAIERTAVRCSITKVMHQPIGTLSKGYRRRVCLAQALVHDPLVLLLDEPTDGLDPNQKHDVRELIKEMASEKCIVISTHILEEVEAICNRVVIIDQGAVLVDSQPAALCQKEGGSLNEIFRRMTTSNVKKVGGAA